MKLDNIRLVEEPDNSTEPDNKPLTPDQAVIWEHIHTVIQQTVPQQEAQPAGRSFLLHGVTGSGKTEIYLRAIEAVLAQSRQAMLLVPEIALTAQTVRRVAARFPGTVAVVHSRLP